ncbi:flagellar biosynthetic protein FliR [Anaeromicropila herbilytica]|uniref:Flagellar biosynthetic protein FliR n=1 Tax=Anaeromicropila herbilytica TaxID=2785025 RepID=A0A7R7ID91_9FIRM|nr:flagellar biosynthetic protein FliR [Anaeromicropila herbilytica]BCN31518.1 flagellar biosynthetic protein FliR [Anaeromicropila herbilytica]
MHFTIENLEFIILILVRISTFIFTAPIFNLSDVPIRVKAGLSLFITIVLSQVIVYTPLQYVGDIGYASLLIKEAIVGLIIGFVANICSTIVLFAGEIIDMEIGFSMVQILDPVSKNTTTITGNFYSYLVTLMLLVTNLHHFLIQAIVDVYKAIPIGGAKISANMYVIMVRFVVDFFVIGFRIVLPVFAATLLVNVVLAILAKVAPQLNMFVVGLQLKVFVGLFILLLIVGLLPSVTEFIFDEMQKMMEMAIKAMS